MLLIAFLAEVALAAASAAAFYSYGRFARHALGEPGWATPASGPPTALDRIITPLLDTHPGATGILLVDSNREAFELRALSARDAGRSLDLQHYIWKDDQQGRLLVREVLLAADRGVRGGCSCRASATTAPAPATSTPSPPSGPGRRGFSHAPRAAGYS